jgi:thiamine-phosphate diphosphorylase
VISRLHLVTDDRVLADPAFPEKAEAAVAAGEGRATLHLRGPHTSGRRLWERGLQLLPVSRRAHVPFLVNDRVDVALALAADGAHLGRRSLPPADAREILGGQALIGCSLHDAAEARELGGGGGKRPLGPDFVFAGALFSTCSHPGRPPMGAGVIEEVRRELPGVPVLGIGGVTPERVSEVLGAGGHGVAVVGAVWNASDPAEAVRRLLAHIEGWRPPGRDDGGEAG